MCSQVVDNTINEGEGFNFNNWISLNGLHEIKALLIKHNATTTDKLTLISPEMQSLMADQEIYAKTQMIPKLMRALHSISTSVITIVVSEQEQAVIDSIKQNIKMLDKIEHTVNNFKQEYPKSKQKVYDETAQKVEKVKTAINATFDKLFNVLNKRKQVLLKQVDAIKTQSHSQHDSDEKEIDVIKICQVNIKNLRKFLKENEKKYNELIATNKDRTVRKKNILTMGQKVKNEFEQKQQKLHESADVIRNKIFENNHIDIDVNFIFDDKTYKVTVNTIGNLGNVSVHRKELNPPYFQSVQDDGVKKGNTVKVTADLNHLNSMLTEAELVIDIDEAMYLGAIGKIVKIEEDDDTVYLRWANFDACWLPIKACLNAYNAEPTLPRFMFGK